MSPHSISPTDLYWDRDAHPLRRAQGATFCGRNTVRQRALGSGHTHCACVLGMMSEYSMREGSSPCGRCGSRRGLGVRCSVLQARRIPPSKRGIPGIPEAQKSMWNPWNPSWNPCYHSAPCDCHAVRRRRRVTPPATAVPVFGIKTQCNAVGCLDMARGCL